MEGDGGNLYVCGCVDLHAPCSRIFWIWALRLGFIGNGGGGTV